VRTPDISVDRGLLERVKSEGKALVLKPTLKFSCLIAKRFSATIEDPPEDGALIKTVIDGVEVFVDFRAVGSRFCGCDKGFEEFDFPMKDPQKFMPKWIKVRADLSGEFGYA